MSESVTLLQSNFKLDKVTSKLYDLTYMKFRINTQVSILKILKYLRTPYTRINTPKLFDGETAIHNPKQYIKKNVMSK